MFRNKLKNYSYIYMLFKLLINYIILCQKNINLLEEYSLSEII